MIKCCINSRYFTLLRSSFISKVKVKRVYVEFDQDLEKDVVSDTSGYFRRVLVSVLTAGRDESSAVNDAKAQKDAEEIYAVLIQPFCSL